MFRDLRDAEYARSGHSPVILDPFAGVGRIHDLEGETVGVEIEPEWAACRRNTITGNAVALPFPDATFDAVMTSPCYGNRMADHHNAKDGSVRHGYKFDLGRDPTPGSAGAMQWGDEYRGLHQRAVIEMARVLQPSGLCAVNMSNHIRKKREQYVVEWWIETLADAGLAVRQLLPVDTQRQRHGENAGARVDHEVVIVTKRHAGAS